MMKKLSLGLISILFLLMGSMAFADNFKIGVIDLDKILQADPQVKAADAQFKKEFTPREEKIKTAAQDLQDEVEKVKKNRSVMTKSELEAAQQKIENDQDSLDAMQAQFSQDVQTAQAKAMQNILTQIKSVVNTVAQKSGYDIVLQKSNTVYYKEQYDITTQVIAALKK